MVFCKNHALILSKTSLEQIVDFINILPLKMFYVTLILFLVANNTAKNFHIG